MNVSLKSSDAGRARRRLRTRSRREPRARTCLDAHAGSVRRRSMPSSLLVQPARRRAPRDAVRRAARTGCPSATASWMWPSTRARERRAVPRPVVGEELALEPRHVHADRALGLAGAALEAEVEHLVHALVAEARLAEPAGHRQPQHVGAPARRVRLLARRHVRRAHRAVERLAARADAAAHLDGAAHAAVLGVVEERRRAAASGSRRRSAGCAVSGGASTILPGLKMPCGIERPLDRRGTPRRAPARTSSP